MALTLGTNSYATLEEANDYYDDNLREESWESLKSPVRSQALVTASLNISNSVIESARLPIDLPIDSILKQATYELALDMALDADLVTTPGTTTSNLKKVEAGSVSVEYFKQTRAQPLSDRILRILSAGGYAFVPSVPIGASFSSGTSDSSSFDCPPNRTKGYF